MPATTIDTYALTTLASLKRNLGITASTDDTLLTELINAAGAKIERIAGRKFAARTFRERLNGVGQEVVTLRNWPVLYVGRAVYGAANAFDLTFSGSAIRAMAQVYFDEDMTAAGSGVRLVSIASNGTETATTSGLDFDTVKSVNALVTAINLVSGWTATELTNVPTLELSPLVFSSLTDQTASFTYPDSNAHATLVDPARGLIQLRTRTDDWRWNHGGGHYSSLLSNPFYETPGAFRGVLVEYRGGYATIPDDIGQLANEFAALLYRQSLKDGSVQSENLGAYSYTLADQTKLTESMTAKLAPYTEVR
jgi:hypothetical protein